MKLTNHRQDLIINEREFSSFLDLIEQFYNTFLCVFFKSKKSNIIVIFDRGVPLWMRNKFFNLDPLLPPLVDVMHPQTDRTMSSFFIKFWYAMGGCNNPSFSD